MPTFEGTVVSSISQQEDPSYGYDTESQSHYSSTSSRSSSGFKVDDDSIHLRNHHHHRHHHHHHDSSDGHQAHNDITNHIHKQEQQDSEKQASQSQQNEQSQQQQQKQKSEQKPTTKKKKSPSVSTINVEEVLDTKLTNMQSLDELEPLETLAVFQRLVDDLLKLNQHYRPHNYNCDNTLKNIGDDDGLTFTDSEETKNFDLTQFFMDDSDGESVYRDLKLLIGQPALDEQSQDANTNINTVSATDELEDELQMERVPKLMFESVDKLVKQIRISYASSPEDNVTDTDTLSLSSFDHFNAEYYVNTGLDVPLKKKSKLGKNFKHWRSRSRSSLSSIASSSSRKVLPHKSLLIADLHNLELITSFEAAGRLDYERHLDCMKKFYLKVPPKLTVTTYLDRINQYISPSSAVILSAACYLFNLVFDLKFDRRITTTIPSSAGDAFDDENNFPRLKMLPVDQLNVYRLILTVVRVASKLVEDKNFKQSYYCKVCGLQNLNEMFRLELNCIELLDFNLFINEKQLIKFLFQFKLFDLKLQRFFKENDGEAAN
ncbi:unnamed protein product [Ambrosiozyma monospora]|uniref:Unnamed protein product n=1 Tax=Ambrosiozyma monospora TaxID=43982 RepID=A0A9W7DI99_AMBMO|nr:unnamed protein product [Ambrosiozyma monospora]